MYRVILRNEPIASDIGAEAAADITDGFKMRPWHQSAVCVYEAGRLTLTSENDFDDDGLATQDEFSDEYAANVVNYDNGASLKVQSVEQF